MSLSSQTDVKRDDFSGKVLLGSASAGQRETTVAEIERSRRRDSWGPQGEAEYMERVKLKATAMAREIVTRASHEAKQMRDKAYQEGYEQGAAQAQQQLEQAQQEIGESLTQALAQVQQGARQIWAEHRQTLLAVVTMAVSKALGTELAQRRQEVLAYLFDEAVQTLDSQRRLLVRAHPEDTDYLKALLEEAKARYPDLRQWKVRQDPNLTPGGLVLESEAGMVDNSLEGRLAAVEGIFDQLMLPVDDEQLLAQPVEPQYIPEPIPEPVPEPIPEPEPVQQVMPEPVPVPAPQPDPAPQPVVAQPEQQVMPEPAPAPEPVAEPLPEPVSERVEALQDFDTTPQVAPEPEPAAAMDQDAINAMLSGDAAPAAPEPAPEPEPAAAMDQDAINAMLSGDAAPAAPEPAPKPEPAAAAMDQDAINALLG